MSAFQDMVQGMINEMVDNINTKTANESGDAMGDMLTTEEAAALLGVTAGRIRQLVRDGDLPSTKRAGAHFYRRVDLEGVRERPKAGWPKGKPRGQPKGDPRQE